MNKINGNEKDENPFRRSGKLMRSPTGESRQSRSRSNGESDTTQTNVATEVDWIFTNTSGNDVLHTNTRGIEAVSAGTLAATPRQTPTGATQLRQTPTGARPKRVELVTANATNDSTPCVDIDLEGTLVATKETSPRLEMIDKMRKNEEDAIIECKTIIVKMQQAFKRQKNISNDVRGGVSKISELLDVIESYRRTWKTAERGRMLASSQIKSASKKKMESVSTPPTNKSKRVANSPLVPESSKKPREKEPIGKEQGITGEQKGDWMKVPRKGDRKTQKNKPRRKNRAKPRNIKPEAVMIKPKEGHSYAEVLKDLRSKVAADDSSNIRCVRKTKSGAILLELEKGKKLRSEFVQQLKSSVRETASVAELKARATVEIRDLDSLTTKEEIENAIRGLLPNTEEEFRTRVTVPNSRDQVRAFVSLPAESASNLIEVGHVRIGWIRARIRKCEEIKRCYRCLGMGHIQANCTGVDRRDICIRCGCTGHKMKDCKAAPRCVHCVDAKRDKTDHLPGTRGCAILKA